MSWLYAPSRTLVGLLKATAAVSGMLLSITPPITATTMAVTQAIMNTFMELAPLPERFDYSNMERANQRSRTRTQGLQLCCSAMRSARTASSGVLTLKKGSIG